MNSGRFFAAVVSAAYTVDSDGYPMPNTALVSVKREYDRMQCRIIELERQHQHDQERMQSLSSDMRNECHGKLIDQDIIHYKLTQAKRIIAVLWTLRARIRELDEDVQYWRMQEYLERSAREKFMRRNGGCHE